MSKIEDCDTGAFGSSRLNSFDVVERTNCGWRRNIANQNRLSVVSCKVAYGVRVKIDFCFGYVWLLNKNPQNLSKLVDILRIYAQFLFSNGHQALPLSFQ